MNLLGLGCDWVDIAKLEKSMMSDAFRNRVFTPAEIDFAQTRPKPLESYAGKFAVKEAVMKCLGGGIQQGVWFTHIETLNSSTGAPYLTLYEVAQSLAVERGIVSWQISISHTAHTAGAVVLALG